jgi:hypothetical protein
MSSRFWYYPNNSGLVTVNLGRTITEMRVPTTDFRQASATSWSGERTVVQWGGVEQSRIRLEWGGTSAVDRAVRRELVAMLNHMDRGGSVMFAVEHTRFYAGFLGLSYPVGDTVIFVVPTTDAIAPAVNIADTEIVLRSANPNCKIECQHVSAHAIGPFNTDGALTINPGLQYDFAGDGWVLVREMGSWPALRLPEGARGRPHLTGDHETKFVLDLPVEEDETSLAIQFENQGTSGGATGETPQEPILTPGAVGISTSLGNGPRGWNFG